MIKSNSKKAIENIKKYVVSWYDPNETGDFSEVASVIFDKFMNEYARGNRRRINRQDLFVEWAAGLPCNGLFCFWYNREAVDDLGAILEESETEKARFTEDQAETYLTKLIYREIVKFA